MAYNPSLDYFILAASAFKDGKPEVAARFVEKSFSHPSVDAAIKAIEKVNSKATNPTVTAAMRRIAAASDSQGVEFEQPGDATRIIPKTQGPKKYDNREVQTAESADDDLEINSDYDKESNTLSSGSRYMKSSEDSEHEEHEEEEEEEEEEEHEKEHTESSVSASAQARFRRALANLQTVSSKDKTPKKRPITKAPSLNKMTR